MISKLKNIVQKSYKYIAYFAIILVLLLINYFHIFNDKIIENVIFIVSGLIILLIINKFIINKIKDRTLTKIILVLLGIFIILEILSVYYFKVQYNWDFKWIMESAKDIATTGTTPNIFYFKIFPNNWGVLIITTLAMKITFGNEVGAYAINIIFIFLSVLFSVLSAKKIGGNKLALNVLILMLGSAPLYLYSPIVYTDTLSVAFPVATLYLWLISKEYKEKSVKGYYASIIAMAFIGAIGYCIKPVAGIVLVAIIIDEIFTNINKETLKKIAITLIVMLTVIVLFNKLCEKFVIKDSQKNEYQFPLTHWIMMGLDKPESEGGTSIGYGAYSQKDADYTSTSGNYEEKKTANILKIKERLKEFGIKGYTKFLFNKFNYIWNDGSYYVLNVIGWDTLNTTSTLYKLVIGEESYKIFRPYMTNFNNCVFFIILLGLIIELLKKEKNQVIRILGISIVGIAIFLLVWEARSRYIYFLIPVFCILAAYEMLQIFNFVERRILKQKNKQ